MHIIYDILAKESKSKSDVHELSVILVTKSKARVYYLFRPKDIVQGENYEIGVILKNLKGEAFHGGRIKAAIRYSGTSITESYLETNKINEKIPKIEGMGAVKINFGTYKATMPGMAFLSNIEIQSQDNDSVPNFVYKDLVLTVLTVLTRARNHGISP